MTDEDLSRLKQDFDAVCQKYDFQGDAMSSKLADFLTSGKQVRAQEMADTFGMTMKDANTFLMWVQIGTQFKSEVIDRNAQAAREGRL